MAQPSPIDATASEKQENLHNWINDEENLKRAAEGSMEKRRKVLYPELYTPQASDPIDSEIRKILAVCVSDNQCDGYHPDWQMFTGDGNETLDNPVASIKALITQEREKLLSELEAEFTDYPVMHDKDNMVNLSHVQIIFGDIKRFIQSKRTQSEEDSPHGTEEVVQ